MCHCSTIRGTFSLVDGVKHVKGSRVVTHVESDSPAGLPRIRYSRPIALPQSRTRFRTCHPHCSCTIRGIRGTFSFTGGVKHAKGSCWVPHVEPNSPACLQRSSNSRPTAMAPCRNPTKKGHASGAVPIEASAAHFHWRTGWKVSRGAGTPVPKSLTPQRGWTTEEQPLQMVGHLWQAIREVFEMGSSAQIH